MTPTEQWILELALVYAVPSFLAGIGATLLVIRWQGIARALARFLSPGLMFEGRDLADSHASAADQNSGVLPERLRAG